MFKFNKLITLFLASLSISVYMSAFFSAKDYKDVCATLGVSENSSIQDIKKAYKNKAKIVHPDVTGGTKEAFCKVDDAYKYLEKYFKYQIPKSTNSGSNTYSSNTSSGYRAHSRSNAYTGNTSHKIRYIYPGIHEDLFNQYKASKNASYGSSSSKETYSNSGSNTYSKNTTSGFANTNNTYSGSNTTSVPKNSVFSKIKGKYVLGAASCYGLYRYMNPKTKTDTAEPKLDGKENASSVPKASFFGKIGNIVTTHPYKLTGTIAVTSALGYIIYQKYAKPDSDDQKAI